MGSLDPSTENSNKRRREGDKAEDQQATEVRNSSSTGKEKAKADLDEAVEKTELIDLHAHLFGMGKAEFWVGWLKKVSTLPSQDQAVFWRNSKFVTWEELGRDDVQKNKTQQTQTAEFATKLVLSDVSLYQAVLADKAVKDPLTEDEKKALVRKLVLDTSSALSFKLYEYFDARRQEYVVVNGIYAEDLIKHLDFRSDLDHLLENCFQMLDNDGKPPSESTMHQQYRDRFSYQFYPKMYSLKDDIVAQFPSVVNGLFNHIAERYCKGGVGYAELSISIGDALRPHMMSLFPPSVTVGSRDVQFRYLAMFNRTDSPDKSSLCSVHKDKLKKLDLQLDKNADLRKKLVGLDYAGDESKQKFCTFHLAEFQTFLCKHLKVGPFGFRIHAAECLPLDLDAVLIEDHLLSLAETITPLLNRFGFLSPCPIRIGHGIGLAWALKNPRKVNATIHEMCTLIKTYDVPIEVCLTSNVHLLSGFDSPHEFWGRLEKNDFNVIFGTDDDGIWDCNYDEHVSLASEYARAIHLDPTLDVGQIMKRSSQAAFNKPVGKRDKAQLDAAINDIKVDIELRELKANQAASPVETKMDLTCFDVTKPYFNGIQVGGEGVWVMNPQIPLEDTQRAKEYLCQQLRNEARRKWIVYNEILQAAKGVLASLDKLQRKFQDRYSKNDTRQAVDARDDGSPILELDGVGRDMEHFCLVDTFPDVFRYRYDKMLQSRDKMISFLTTEVNALFYTDLVKIRDSELPGNRQEVEDLFRLEPMWAEVTRSLQSFQTLIENQKLEIHKNTASQLSILIATFSVAPANPS